MEITDIRIGHGYDVHRLVEGRKLIIGGIEIPYEKGLLGHSDADVLLHALMDAILGALGLGDIGKHFPDNDERYSGIDSTLLASQTYDLMTSRGYRVGNIDATVIAQAPKLAPYLPAMKEKIASIYHVASDRVNLKATTEEKLGFTGSGEGISAHAVCLIVSA